MSYLQCPICTSTDLTQEGLLPIQIRKGYWKCNNCQQLVRPLVMPDVVTPPPAEES